MKYHCPNCGSTSIWEQVMVYARIRINSPKVYRVPYGFETWQTYDIHEDACGCNKCGWEGKESELIQR